MPDRNDAALEFLLTRRSRPAKTLTAPGPDRAALTEILTAAARTPDHGKLEPWRFIVLGPQTRAKLADAAQSRAEAAGQDSGKARSQFDQSHCAVAVITSPKPSEKTPEIEQVYSAGAVCLALLNAALAAGWGANWLSGWVSHDRVFVESELGLAPHEQVAGFIHIGTETNRPPERPRPDVTAITKWQP